MDLSATVRFKKSNWLGFKKKIYTLLLGDSVIVGLLRYLRVWPRHFTPLKALNLGIKRGDVENVLWLAMNLSILPSLKNVVALCGTNNLFTDPPMDIADCIVNIGFCLCEKSSNISVFICGLIPRDESWSVNRVLIKDITGILKYLCLKHDFSFIDQSNGRTSNGWTFTNGDLNPSLFFGDSLHLIEQENFKLAKLITNSIPLTTFYLKLVEGIHIVTLLKTKLRFLLL